MAQLRELFPALDDFSVTSPEEGRYNCVAWAAGVNTRWWWPDASSYWPPEAPLESNVAAFIAVFRAIGYEPCDNGSLQDGFEKVAIYESASGVKHMARQLRTGRWTSKLGGLEDIEHACPAELEGVEYGAVVQYMQRAVS